MKIDKAAVLLSSEFIPLSTPIPIIKIINSPREETAKETFDNLLRLKLSSDVCCS